MIRSKITELLQPCGFLPFAWHQSKTLWFTRQRDPLWTDALCFEIQSNQKEFSLSFGIEYSPVRDLALKMAETISPALFTGHIRQALGFTERPCTNIFHAPSEINIERDHFSRSRIDKSHFEGINANFFCKINSEDDYLNFLLQSTDVFEWGRSAAAFRLIYIGFLLHRQGHASSEYRDHCNRIPVKFLENHAILNSAGLNACDFIETCIELIWGAESPH